ncbi:WD40-repeat-containing domain protein [Mycena sp. CBHHK59/15]|nr:WD40-repeat-containing domain protein [Mycena sp. CBHHK59/15]
MFFSTRNKVGDAAEQNQYALHSILHGNQEAVQCLKVNEDGTLLASGGADGIRLWDLRSNVELDRPSIGGGQRGATTALLWIRRDDYPGEILVSGTQGGHLCIWIQAPESNTFEEKLPVPQLFYPSEITGLAFDSSTNRLAVCNRERMVQVHVMNDKIELGSAVVKRCKQVPMAIFFSSDREVVVFANGEKKRIRYDANTLEIIRSQEIGTCIGSVDYNHRKGVFCLDDVYNGPALFKVDTEVRTKSWEVAKPKAAQKKLDDTDTGTGTEARQKTGNNGEFPRPRKVCFAEDCTSVVSGSNHGLVHVFHRRRENVVDKLDMQSGGLWVQAVAAAEIEGASTIFAASSKDGHGGNPINVWKKQRIINTTVTRPKRRISICTGFMVALLALNITILVAVAIHFYQDFSKAYSLLKF